MEVFGGRINDKFKSKAPFLDMDKDEQLKQAEKEMDRMEKLHLTTKKPLGEIIDQFLEDTAIPGEEDPGIDKVFYNKPYNKEELAEFEKIKAEPSEGKIFNIETGKNDL